jgi:hypothetical protein
VEFQIPSARSEGTSTAPGTRETKTASKAVKPHQANKAERISHSTSQNPIKRGAAEKSKNLLALSSLQLSPKVPHQQQVSPNLEPDQQHPAKMSWVSKAIDDIKAQPSEELYPTAYGSSAKDPSVSIHMDLCT